MRSQVFVLVRCQGTKSAIRNDIPVRSSAGALGIVDANSPPSPSAGRIIEVGGIVVDTQATGALKLFLAAATGQRLVVQRPPVPGRERVPDAVTTIDGGLRRHVQAFNGGYEEIRI